MVAPIGVAAVAFALSFGVLARSAGMGWVAPLVMSATTFAGSAQFAVTSILHDAGSAAAAILAAVMLNARYAPIGISVASAFDGTVPKRLLESQLVVDESWAMALRRKGGFDIGVLLGAGGVLYIGWTRARSSVSFSVTSSETPTDSGSTPPFRRCSSPS